MAAGQIGQPPVPSGQVFQYTMTTLGRLADVHQFADMTIKTDAAGRIVRVRDVGRIELGAQSYDQTCTLDGRPSVALSIYQLPGTNALKTANLVRDKMEELKQAFPAGLDYSIVYDTTPFINESISEVFITLIDAVLLVAFVVLLFLQNWRSAVIPLVAVPVAVIGTFAVMAAMGFSLNNLTLFGLVLAIGIVVDDAIVVVEAVEHHIEAGLPHGGHDQGHGPGLRAGDRRGAGAQGGVRPLRVHHRHHGPVFPPVRLDDRRVDGDFGLQLADSQPGPLGIAVAAQRAAVARRSPAVGGLSAVGGLAGLRRPGAALTHVVAAAAPRPDEPSSPTSPWIVPVFSIAAGACAGGVFGRRLNHFVARCFRAFNLGFNYSTNVYTRLVGMFLRVSVLVLLVYGGLLYLTWWGFTNSPSGFIPMQDKGYLLVNIQLPDAASVERTERVMRRIEEIAGKTAGVKHTVAVAGQSILLGANAPNFGAMYVMLDDFHKRSARGLSGEAIAAALQARFQEEIKDGMVGVFGAPPIDGLGTAGGFKIIIEDRGDVGMKALQEVGEKIVDHAGHEVAGLQGLFSSFRADTPWLFLDIDRDQAKTMGLSMAEVFNTLQVYLGSLYVNDFNRFGRTWQVNVQADAQYRRQVEDLKQYKIRNGAGTMVPLGSIASTRETSGPVMIYRYNMYSAAPINGAPAPGVSSGEAIGLMQQVADDQLVHAMRAEWTELAMLQLETGNTAMYVFVLAVVLVFLVLAAQYESWSLPLAVILVVPMCLLCSIAGVLVARLDVNIFTQIGFVVLVGLACKNAILIVEYAKRQSEQGKPRHEATLSACKLRLRPIMMTSFAFILGVVPLVVSVGAGAEMRRTLGTAVFAGMLGVTLFGIFLTPVFYNVIQWYSEWLAARRAAAESETQPAGELASS